MGRTYVRTLGDCNKHGLVLEIVCSRCGRPVYRAPGELIGYTTRGGFRITPNMHVEMLAPVLRCKGGSGSIGCGARGARIRAMWPHELKVPPGVPALMFLNADDRERKRLMRIARG